VLPWSKSSAGEVDILRAKEILDEDHYGLKKVRGPHPGLPERAPVEDRT